MIRWDQVISTQRKKVGNHVRKRLCTTVTGFEWYALATVLHLVDLYRVYNNRIIKLWKRVIQVINALLLYCLHLY